VKTIATFSLPEEAHLLRTRLESVGIPAFVQDEHFVQLDWLYSNAIGGVRVQVADEDLEATREFLAADAPQPCPEAEEVDCTWCGSSDVELDPWPRLISYLAVLICRFPFLYTRRRWRCLRCHQYFRPKPSATAWPDSADFE